MCVCVKNVLSVEKYCEVNSNNFGEEILEGISEVLMRSVGGLGNWGPVKRNKIEKGFHNPWRRCQG